MKRSTGPLIAALVIGIIVVMFAMNRETISRFVDLPSESTMKTVAYVCLVPAFLLYLAVLWSNRKRFWPFR